MINLKILFLKILRVLEFLNFHTSSRVFRVLICSNQISAPDTNLNPVKFGWNIVDSVLMPNVSLHYQRWTLLLVVARKNTLKDVSVDSLTFDEQNFTSATEKNIVPIFTNMDTVGYCIRYANMKVISYMDRILGREHPYIHIFYSLWRISFISPEIFTLLNKNKRHENN